MAPAERLPDAAPLPVFFVPNFLGIVVALALEAFHVESFLKNCLDPGANRFALLGFAVFTIACVNSFLGGSVILARIQYDVKLPNLYANPSTSNDNDANKNAILFNCVQRGHQNFLETFGLVTLAALFTAFAADRPNIAAMMLFIIAASRVSYQAGYRSNNVNNRMAGMMVALFTMSIGIGYAFCVGLTAFGLHLMNS